MRRSFKLRCESRNANHTKFSIFDQTGANCGTLTVRSQDAEDFVRFDWNGDVDWNGHTHDVVQ